MNPWFEIANPADVPSPALLIWRDRVEANLQRMIALAGGPQRLRPHIKTHKLPGLIQRQLELGITRFKCATVAEAEMAAAVGAPDVLLAYQPVGPNVERLLELAVRHPAERLSCLADCPEALMALSDAATRASVRLEVLLDLDVGQHRTGLEPDQRAFELYRLLGSLPSLAPGGLHAYDGHLHDPNLEARAAACEAAFAPVVLLRRRLLEAGLAVPRLVVGGTPTFPIHARRPDVECSPGTCVLWDAGYAKQLPDLDFVPAAALLTRVVSKPQPQRLCLDLGHKAVASEMAHPRVVFLNLPEAKAVAHNEEHLAVDTPQADAYPLGACLWALPWHICPTVALHAEVWVVTDGRAEERWPVTARARRLTL